MILNLYFGSNFEQWHGATSIYHIHAIELDHSLICHHYCFEEHAEIMDLGRRGCGKNVEIKPPIFLTNDIIWVFGDVLEISLHQVKKSL